MEILTTLGIFVIIVILGSFLNNLFPRIPAALFQIILGAAVTFIPNLPLHFEFESEMFMMLIIAPLLYYRRFQRILKEYLVIQTTNNIYGNIFSSYDGNCCW